MIDSKTSDYVYGTVYPPEASSFKSPFDTPDTDVKGAPVKEAPETEAKRSKPKKKSVYLAGLAFLSVIACFVFIHESMTMQTIETETENVEAEIEPVEIEKKEYASKNDLIDGVLTSLNNQSEEDLVACSGFLAEKDPAYAERAREIVNEVAQDSTLFDIDSIRFTHESVERLDNCEIYTIGCDVDRYRKINEETQKDVKHFTYVVCHKDRHYTLVDLR